MEKPLVKLLLFYLLGLFSAYYLEVPYLTTSLAALLSLVVSLFLPSKCLRMKSIVLSLTIILIGMSWLGWHLQVRQKVFQPFYGQFLILEGIVAGLPEQKENGCSTLVESLVIKNSQGRSYKIKEKVLLFSPGEMQLQPGDLISTTVFLEALPLQRNPGEFSYGNYLMSQGIKARAIISSPEKLKIIGSSKGITSGVYQWRKAAQEDITKLLPAPFSSLVEGIIFGQAQSLPSKIKEDFQRIGLTHVLAASGQNMVIIIALFWGIGKFLLLPKALVTVGTIFFIISYTLAAGANPSIVRAAIMAIIMLAAPFLGRKRDLPSALALAAGLILAVQPLALWNISFQLSFLAVLALFIFTPLLQPMFAYLPKPLSTPLTVAAAIQLGVVPLTIYYFNQWSLISFFANLLILPFLEGVLLMGLLLVSLGMLNLWIAKALAGFLWLLSKTALFLSAYLSSWPWAMLEVPGPQGYGLIFYYLALGILAYICLKVEKKKFLLTVWGLGVLIVLLAFGLMQSFSSTLQVTFLDVGQGDAIFIQAPGGEKILLDGGGQPAFYQRKVDIGEKIVLPFLLKKGVEKLDLVLVSHFHEDHVGGINSILRRMKVDRVIVGQLGQDEEISQVFWALVREQGIPFSLVQRGEVLQLRKGVTMTILHPGKKALVDTHSDSNNNSLVIKLEYKKASFLLVGDLEAEGEKELLKEQENQLTSGVLKVGHHGSSFSSQADFLEKIHPQIAVISVGAKNSFGHPSPEVLDRLKQQNAVIYRTDRQGGIVIETNGTNYRVKVTKKGEI